MNRNKTIDDELSEPQQKTKPNDDESRCEECKSRLERDSEHGELVCANCGLVQKTKEFSLDYRPARAFSMEQADERRHSGPPSTISIHDKGLSTDIGWKDKDSYGKSIPQKNRFLMYRLRKWQRRIRVANSTERNISSALQELDHKASLLGLPKDARETAAYIYRRALDKNLIRGRSIEGVVAASLYAACRNHEIPRTLDEIAAVTRKGRKEIGRTYRFITRELGLRIRITKPEDYVPRFCSELKLDNDVQAKTMEILGEAREKELVSGRGPTGVTAAAMYIASILCNKRIPQSEIANKANVTEVTIRNRYKELEEKLGYNISPLL